MTDYVDPYVAHLDKKKKKNLMKKYMENKVRAKLYTSQVELSTFRYIDTLTYIQDAILEANKHTKKKRELFLLAYKCPCLSKLVCVQVTMQSTEPKWECRTLIGTLQKCS